MQIKIIAKAIYFIADDETASEYQSTVIEHEGALWLVAKWFESNDTGKRFPDRIVPLEKLPHPIVWWVQTKN